ncbi:MAG: hypothetical protein HY594_01750, partial [Candidatus Omnitrophica bacterium]|nr:hypothetical protein [Candidatus Omnitrophota bacterium]
FETLFDTKGVTTQQNTEYDSYLLINYGFARATQLATVTETETGDGTISYQRMEETRTYSHAVAGETPASIGALATDLVIRNPNGTIRGWRYAQMDRDRDGVLDVAGLLLTASGRGTSREQTLTGSSYSVDADGNGSYANPGVGIEQTFEVIFNSPRINREIRRLKTELFDGTFTRTTIDAQSAYTTGDETLDSLTQVSIADRQFDPRIGRILYEDPARRGFARRGLLKIYQAQVTSATESWTADETTTHILQGHIIQRQQALLSRQTTDTRTTTSEGSQVRTVESYRYFYTRRGMKLTDPVRQWFPDFGGDDSQPLAALFSKTDYLDAAGRILARFDRDRNGEFDFENLLLALTPETLTLQQLNDRFGYAGGDRITDPFTGREDLVITGAWSRTLGIDFSITTAQIITEYNVLNNRAAGVRTSTISRHETAGGDVTTSYTAARNVYSKKGEEISQYADTDYADYRNADGSRRFFDANGKMKFDGLLKAVIDEAPRDAQGNALSFDFNGDGDTTDAGEATPAGSASRTVDAFGNVTASFSQSLDASRRNSHRIIAGRDVVEATWTFINSTGADGSKTHGVNFLESAFSRGENPKAGFVRFGGVLVPVRDLLRFTNYLSDPELRARILDGQGNLRRGLLLAVAARTLSISASDALLATTNSSITRDVFGQESRTTQVELGPNQSRYWIFHGKPREAFNQTQTIFEDSLGNRTATVAYQVNSYTTGNEALDAAQEDAGLKAAIVQFLAKHGLAGVALPNDIARLPGEFFEDGRIRSELLKDGKLRKGIFKGGVSYSDTVQEDFYNTTTAGDDFVAKSYSVQFLTSINGNPRPLLSWSVSYAAGLVGDSHTEAAGLRFTYSRGGENSDQILPGGIGYFNEDNTVRSAFLTAAGRFRRGLLIRAELDTASGVQLKHPDAIRTEQVGLNQISGEDALGFSYTGRLVYRDFIIDRLGRTQQWKSQEKRLYKDLLGLAWRDTAITFQAGLDGTARGALNAYNLQGRIVASVTRTRDEEIDELRADGSTIYTGIWRDTTTTWQAGQLTVDQEAVDRIDARLAILNGQLAPSMARINAVDAARQEAINRYRSTLEDIQRSHSAGFRLTDDAIDDLVRLMEQIYDRKAHGDEAQAAELLEDLNERINTVLPEGISRGEIRAAVKSITEDTLRTLAPLANEVAANQWQPLLDEKMELLAERRRLIDNPSGFDPDRAFDAQGRIAGYRNTTRQVIHRVRADGFLPNADWYRTGGELYNGEAQRIDTTITVTVQGIRYWEEGDVAPQAAEADRALPIEVGKQRSYIEIIENADTPALVVRQEYANVRYFNPVYLNEPERGTDPVWASYDVQLASQLSTYGQRGAYDLRRQETYFEIHDSWSSDAGRQGKLSNRSSVDHERLQVMRRLGTDYFAPGGGFSQALGKGTVVGYREELLRDMSRKPDSPNGGQWVDIDPKFRNYYEYRRITIADFDQYGRATDQATRIDRQLDKYKKNGDLIRRNVREDSLHHEFAIRYESTLNELKVFSVTQTRDFEDNKSTTYLGVDKRGTRRPWFDDQGRMVMWTDRTYENWRDNPDGWRSGGDVNWTGGAAVVEFSSTGSGEHFKIWGKWELLFAQQFNDWGVAFLSQARFRGIQAQHGGVEDFFGHGWMNPVRRGLGEWWLRVQEQNEGHNRREFYSGKDGVGGARGTIYDRFGRILLMRVSGYAVVGELGKTFSVVETASLGILGCT